MVGQIEAINGALRLIGTRRITDLDGLSEEARVAAEAWPVVRDSVTRAHPWNWAMRRTPLAATTPAPPFGFRSAFPVPADCLRVWEVCDLGPEDWQVENGTSWDCALVILANSAGPLNVRYIARVDNVERWDAMAVRLLECDLALEMVERLGRDGRVAQQIAAKREEALAAARNADGMENPPVIIEPTSFITCR